MSELQLLSPITNGKAALWDLFRASIQTAISFLLGFLPNTISIFLLEFQNETLSVGALGLGILVTQGIGMGVLNGMATGLETLVSQAYGANQYELCAKLYYRSLFICHLLMIPISLILLFSSQLLSFINNNKELTEETGKFSKWMIIAVYFDGIFVNTKAFMNGQNIYNYQFYTQMITCVLFIAICYVLVVILKLGIVGCAISMTCLEILNNIVLFSFIIATKCCKTTYYKFQISYLHNLIKFLKEAIPIGLILWLEWLSYEGYVILSSYLQDEMITTHVLMANFGGFLYQFSYGVSIASTTFVGNEMGRKQIKMAITYTKATFILDLIFLSVLLLPIVVFGNYFISLITKDEIVQEQLHKCFYLLIIFIVLDGIQSVLSGLVRAIGREKSASFTFLLCYIVIGDVLGYLLGYTLNLELFGIWIGICIGVLCYNIIQFFNLIWKDWNILAEEISVKLSSINQQHIVDDDDEQI